MAVWFSEQNKSQQKMGKPVMEIEVRWSLGRLTDRRCPCQGHVQICRFDRQIVVAVSLF